MFDELRRRWRDGRDAWGGLRGFEALPRQARRIVFYAETAADWAHLGPVAQSLERRGKRVIRITSDRRDPALGGPDAFFVGFGSARTVLFRTIDADAFVMTLSDLGRYHLKRSVHPVHYFYVFHSIASTHRVYGEHAFDAYDTILCVGPHQLEEIRRTEQIYGLPPKRLLEHGYGRLDTLIADLTRRERPPSAGARPHVLVAPSWGECSIVQHCLEPMLAILLAAGFEVALRLHPMTVRQEPMLAEGLVRRHGGDGRFHYDPHVETTEALLAADVMISEWSGAPLEYAFARERPVLFIDTPPKIHNPSFARVGLPGLEVEIREAIGGVVALDQLHALPDAVHALLAEAPHWKDRIRDVRDRTVFNVGRSGEVAAQHILDTLPRSAGA
jgi:YidC/Oxa1 family membrane protein insertase